MHGAANSDRDAAVNLVEPVDGVGALVERDAQPCPGASWGEADPDGMQARYRLQPKRRRHLSDQHDLRLCPQVADSTRPRTEMNHDLDAAIRENRLGQRIVAGFQFPEARDVSSEIGEGCSST